MKKATEVPSFTKPVGKPGDERTEGAYKKKTPTREHPHNGVKYDKVGKSCCGAAGEERAPSMVAKKDCCRPHPHAISKPGAGYGQIGKGKATGAERTQGAYKKKSPTR